MLIAEVGDCVFGPREKTNIHFVFDWKFSFFTQRGFLMHLPFELCDICGEFNFGWQQRVSVPSEMFASESFFGVAGRKPSEWLTLPNVRN